MNNKFRKTMLGRIFRHRSGLIGLFMVLFFLGVAIFAPLIAPYSPIEQNTKVRLQPPGGNYALGTDEFGRDVLSRLMHGATNSLQVSLTAVAISGLLGTLLGLIAGYWGGLLDNLLMRLMDLIFAFPAMLLALAISAALGPGLGNTILAISIVYLPIFARVARGSAMQIKQLEYIEATRCLGGTDWRILRKHVLPNSLTPTIVQVSLALSWAMLTEASLSFLGLGTTPPTPSWGAMLNDARRLMELAPWLAIAPGVAIMLGVLGFNLLGDGLRDIMDPRLRSFVK
jgi:peptide/nickel transport system permease protein